MDAVATPLELVRQSVANFERKQRNLVKRKSKLDGYRDKLSKGDVLNEEQRKAVDGYEGVLQSINVVQEFITQLKELADDIERSVKYEESQQAIAHERYTLSFLHTHVCLMRLLNSLDINSVRIAVARASSENHLKLLDVLRNLVTAPIIDTWPGTSTAALADAPSFLQQQPALSTVAEHINNFVLGRSAPIPLSNDYDGPHKKFTYKDARILCFRLLATPSVQRSMGLPSRPASIVPSVHEERPVEIVEQETGPVTNICPTMPSTENVTITAPRAEVPVAVPQASPEVSSSTIPPLGILDQVIKPLGGTFNFLQASKVVAPDPLMVVQPPVSEVTRNLPVTNGIPEHHSHFDYHPVNSHTEHAPVATEECYTSPNQSKPTTTFVDSMEPHQEIHSHNDETLHTEENLDLSNEGDLQSSAPVSSKPVSYADLVRRQGYSRTPAQNAPAPTESRKRESLTRDSVDPESAEVSQNDFNASQSVSQGHRPSYGRGGFRGRGDFRGSRGGPNRGGFGGPQRRGAGGSRGGRYEPGSGRGGAPYRGMSTGVAQPTY